MYNIQRVPLQRCLSELPVILLLLLLHYYIGIDRLQVACSDNTQGKIERWERVYECEI
jgi:hypothetical protein